MINLTNPLTSAPSGTLAAFNAQTANFPVTGFAFRREINNTFPLLILEFGGTTNQSALWSLVAPKGFTFPMKAILTIAFPEATEGETKFSVEVEADKGNIDLINSSNFDSPNISGSITPSGTLGESVKAEIVLFNDGAASEGNPLRIKLTRLAGDSSNTIPTSAYVTNVELREV